MKKFYAILTLFSVLALSAGAQALKSEVRNSEFKMKSHTTTQVSPFVKNVQKATFKAPRHADRAIVWPVRPCYGRHLILRCCQRG